MNVGRIAGAISNASKPWIPVASKLGQLLRASVNSEPSSVSLTVSGPSMTRLGK